MTNCLEKSCSFGLPRVSRNLLSMYVFNYFPIGFEGRIWDLIVSVPDHCLSLYFPFQSNNYEVFMFYKMSRLMTKPTLRPAKIQISLGIRPV